MNTLGADIDSAHSLFLLELTEPTENSLRIVVGESSVGEPRDLEIGGTDVVLHGVSPVKHLPGNRVFAVTWETYVTYAVTNESWAVYDKSGPREGRLFVRFEDSSLLRWMKEKTWEDDDPRMHWQINCENHVVDVVSTVEPIITVDTKP